MFDWFGLTIWLFGLSAGIILWILSGKKVYIAWVQDRIPMSEAKIKNMEKSGAIAFTVISLLNLAKIIVS